MLEDYSETNTSLPELICKLVNSLLESKQARSSEISQAISFGNY